MSLVMAVSDHVVALNFGRKIAEGTPAEVQRASGGDRGLSGRRAATDACAARGARGLHAVLRPDAACCTASTSRSTSGGITALLGANGAGKTTTLRALCGMVRDRAASIRFDGERIDGTATEDIVRLGVAHVPDGRGTFAHADASRRTCASAPIRAQRQGRSRGATSSACIALFPAPEGAPRASRPARCRAASSRCWRSPRADAAAQLLLLDEPSFGLAPLIVREIFRILRSINRGRSVSMLLVEQNAALALDLADHAYLLETGRVVLSGSADEAIERDEAVRTRLPRLLKPRTDHGSLPPPGLLRPRHRRHLRQPRAGAGDDLPVDRTTSISPRARWRCSATYIAWALINAGVPYWVAFAAHGGVLLRRSGVVIERIVLRPVREGAGAADRHRVHRPAGDLQQRWPAGSSTYTIKSFPSPFPQEPAFGHALLVGRTSSASIGGDAGACWRCCSPSSASRRSGWPCARRRRIPTSARLVGHPRRLDAGAGLGAGGGDRRGRRHDGRADRLPRPEHDGAASCSTASPARCSAASTARSARWSAASSSACWRTCSAPTSIGTELKLIGGAGADHRRADGAGRRACSARSW